MLQNRLKNYLLKLPSSIKRGLMFFLDLVICAFSVWFAFVLRLNQWGTLDGTQWWALIFAIGLSFPIFVGFELYRPIFRYIGSFAFYSLIKAFLIYTIV